MVFLDFDEEDDHGFLVIVRDIALNVWTRSRATDLLIVKIDSWFGPRWHAFSGKALGAVGLRRRPLRVPPFVPSRIRWQRNFRTLEAPPNQPRRCRIHRWIDSETNLNRRFDDVVPDTAVIWFSGSTRPNGRGAIMAYARERIDSYGWYAGWVRTTHWLPTQLRDISRTEILRLSGGANIEDHEAAHHAPHPGRRRSGAGARVLP